MSQWGLGLAGPILAVVMLGCLAVLGVMLARTKPPAVRPATTPAEVGSISPAEVSFITGDARLQPEAASATLLDLAARQVVEIEEIGPSLSLVHLRSGSATTELAEPEQLVMQRVARLAVDGAVATGALAEDTAGLNKWWTGFTQAVMTQCRDKGLCRARFTAANRATLSGASLVCGAAFGLLAWLVGLRAPGASDSGGAIGLGIVAGMLVFWGYSQLWGRFDRTVLTQAGAEAAAGWLATRGQLASDAHFRTLPAAAVTIWGRPMAYAAALGLTRAAVEGLPIARTADASHAWSDYSGLWRRVEVRYARSGVWWVLGQPLTVAWRGLVAAAFAGFWVWLGLLLARLVWPSLPSGVAAPAGWIVAGLIALATAGRGLVDLVTPQMLEGEIIRRISRLRPTSGGTKSSYYQWVAIDDGQSPRVRAYLCPDALWGAAAEGDVVQAVVYRHCRWIKQLTTVTPSRFRTSGADETPGITPPG